MARVGETCFTQRLCVACRGWGVELGVGVVVVVVVWGGGLLVCACVCLCVWVGGGGVCVCVCGWGVAPCAIRALTALTVTCRCCQLPVTALELHPLYRDSQGCRRCGADHSQPPSWGHRRPRRPYLGWIPPPPKGGAG